MFLSIFEICFLLLCVICIYPGTFLSLFKTRDERGTGRDSPALFDLISEALNPIRKLRVENESLTKEIEKISLQRNICFIPICFLFLCLCINYAYYIMFWNNMNLRSPLAEFNQVTNEVATETDGLERPQPQVTVFVAPECKICFNTYNNNKHPMHLSGCQSKGCKD